MKGYFTNRKQGENRNVSAWDSITTRVLQGSTLGPLSFSTILNNLFLFVSNYSFNNYPDGNTLYTFGYISWKAAMKKTPGITIDNKLTYKSDINELCKRTSETIGALSAILNITFWNCSTF